MAGGVTKPDAEDLVQKAIEAIGSSAPSMSGEELVYYIQNNLGKHPAKVKTPGTTATGNTSEPKKDIPPTLPQLALNAIESLVELGYKKTDAEKAIQKVVDVSGNNLSEEEYIELALAKPKPAPKPTGIPPVATPVSTPVSKPASEPPKTPEPDKDKKEEPNVGSTKFDDKGNVEWTKPDGTIRKLSAKQINNMTSPRLKAALKKAGYPFEKFGVTNLKETVGGFINPFNATNLL